MECSYSFVVVQFVPCFSPSKEALVCCKDDVRFSRKILIVVLTRLSAVCVFKSNQTAFLQGKFKVCYSNDRVSKLLGDHRKKSC